MSEQGPKGLGEDEVRRIVQEEAMMNRDADPQMLPLADPTTVGMAAFALTTFLLSIINAGWLDQIGTFIPLAFFYGGLVQLLCGMWEFRNNRTFGAVVFTSYGAFWLAFGFLFYFVDSLGILADVGASVGWTLVGWTVFTFYVWIATIKLNRAVFIMFSAFMLTLLLLDVGFLIGVQELIVAGGYTGILLALCAWYISAASFLNSVFGRIVLPLGAPLSQAPLVEPKQPPEVSRYQRTEPQPQQDIQPALHQSTTTEAKGSPGNQWSGMKVTRQDQLQEPAEGSEVEEQQPPDSVPLTAPEIPAGAGALPIEDYDSLSIAGITMRLSGLSPEEIERLRDYEAKNKNRRHVIARFEQALEARRGAR